MINDYFLLIFKIDNQKSIMIQNNFYYKSNKFLILVLLLKDKIIGRLHKFLFNFSSILLILLFFLLFRLSVDKENDSLSTVFQDRFITILDEGDEVLLAVQNSGGIRKQSSKGFFFDYHRFFLFFDFRFHDNLLIFDIKIIKI